jgi:hypothetical protein
MTGVIYDSILMVNDWLTKYIHLIPYLKALNTAELVYTIIKIIIAQYGTSEKIISNKNKLFKSQF